MSALAAPNLPVISHEQVSSTYRLYIHPVVLGDGKPYFQSGLSLTLLPLGAQSLAQGVTLLRYAPAN